MRKGSLLSAVVLTTMAVLLTGCSRNPVAPTLDPSAAPGAGTEPRSWRVLLGDDDARYAAGLSEDAAATEAPGWLRLPARLEEPSTPRR